MYGLIPRLGANRIARSNTFVDKVFDDLFNAPFRKSTWPLAAQWPTLDVTENDEAYVVQLDVPGVESKDLKVEFEDGRLSVKGNKQNETRESTDQVHVVERQYGEFSRAITFDKAVDGENLVADLKDGVLTVTLKKSAVAKPRTIEVRTSE
ncbi:Hsp20/alpha crystallin family protein [Planctomycetota bacterium]